MAWKPSRPRPWPHAHPNLPPRHLAPSGPGRGVSGDVLSQQTHRRALVGVPWQPAAAAPQKGNAHDWLPATTPPVPASAGDESRRRYSPTLPPPWALLNVASRTEVCKQLPGSHIMLGRTLCPDVSESGTFASDLGYTLGRQQCLRALPGSPTAPLTHTGSRAWRWEIWEGPPRVKLRKGQERSKGGLGAQLEVPGFTSSSHCGLRGGRTITGVLSRSK